MRALVASLVTGLLATSPFAIPAPAAQASAAPAPPSASTAAAERLLQLAQQAVTAERSGRWSVSDPANRQTTSFYVGPDGATETEMLSTKIGTFWAHFLLTNRLYINGNADGLYNFAGLRGGPALAEAGKWLATPSSSQAFRQTVLGMQLSSASTPLFLGGAAPSMLAPVEVAGQRLQRVREVADQAGRLLTTVVWLLPSHLPVRITTTNAGAPEVVTYAGWGRTVAIGTPTHWVPVQSSWLNPSWPGRAGPPGIK